MELKELIQVINNKYKVDILETTRAREVVYARKVYCYIARQLKYKLHEIGRHINKKHDVVIYHLKTIDRIYNHDAIKCNEIIDEHKLHITNLKAKKENITRYEYECVLGDLKQLDDTLLKELIETRVKPFIRLTKSRKQYNLKAQGYAPKLRNTVKNPFLS